MLLRYRTVTNWAIAVTLVMLVSGASFEIALADEVALEPSLDNSMYSEASNRSNGAGPHLYAGRTAAGNDRRALLGFDLSGIPSEAIITDVTLTLVMNNGTAIAHTFLLSRVTSAWGEGTSDAGTPGGLGALATKNDATWSHALWPDDMWDSEGGDYASPPSASLDVTSVGPHVFTGSGLREDVQAWVDGAVPNYGWLLTGNETAFQSAKRFGSAQNTDPAQRPVLEVTYMTAIPTQVESWSVIKERFSR